MATFGQMFRAVIAENEQACADIGWDPLHVTRGYKPDPPSRMLPDYEHHQNLYLGVSLNAQGLLDWLFDGRSATARRLSHGLFEVFNVPFTFVPVLEQSRSPTG